MVDKISVLVAASGAAWEAQALEQLTAGAPGVMLLKRCVDLADLLASATSGQARVALVAHGLPGLDADSLALLGRSGLGVVMVAESAALSAPDEDRLSRLGVQHLVSADGLSGLPAALRAACAEAAPADRGLPGDGGSEGVEQESARGRVVAVWGPSGAPGRTTVAVGLAAELAHRGHGAFLLDADAYGGSVGQHLGVLDEVSGMLAAARMANAGQLDGARLGSLARQVMPGLRVLTGLPRADRWTEVREPAFDRVLDLAGSLEAHAVIDTGFSLESGPGDPFGTTPQRNAMTLAALDRADEIVVVGSADPVGLARLARGLVELLDTVPGPRLRVVVNRTRSSLGWNEGEMRAMIEGFVTPASVHFLPSDGPAVDRALVAGKSLVETGDSALRRGIGVLAGSVLDVDSAGQPAKRRFGRRRSGRRR